MLQSTWRHTLLHSSENQKNKHSENMKTKFTTKTSLKNIMAIAAAGLLSLGGLSAKADFLDIDLTGWQAWEGYGDHGDTLNSGVLLSFAPRNRHHRLRFH